MPTGREVAVMVEEFLRGHRDLSAAAAAAQGLEMGLALKVLGRQVTSARIELDRVLQNLRATFELERARTTARQAARELARALRPLHRAPRFTRAYIEAAIGRDMAAFEKLRAILKLERGPDAAEQYEMVSALYAGIVWAETAAPLRDGPQWIQHKAPVVASNVFGIATPEFARRFADKVDEIKRSDNRSTGNAGLEELDRLVVRGTPVEDFALAISDLDLLTPQERAVWDMSLRGLADPAIARSLDVAPSTVRWLRHSAQNRLRRP